MSASNPGDPGERGRSPSQRLRIRYYGHACFSCLIGDKEWILDPFDSPLFDGRFVYPLPRGDFDVAVSSHDHRDHAHLGEHLGAPVHLREDAALDGLSCSFFPTAHDAASGDYLGENRVVLIEGGAGRPSGSQAAVSAHAWRLVHCGDLGEIPGEPCLQVIATPDVLFVPIGGTYTLDAQEAEGLIARLRPRVVIPMHYRTEYCTLPMASPLAFLRQRACTYVPDGEVWIDPPSTDGELGREAACFWMGLYSPDDAS